MAQLITEGNIRIRGKRGNILRFLQEELIPVYELRDHGWTLRMSRDPDTGPNIYFKGTDRHWIETDGEAFDVHFSGGAATKEDQVVCLDRYEGPWVTDYEFWKRKAMKHKVDIRIFSWSGKAWSSIQTWFRNGDVEETTRKYEDFLWDCPYPEFNEV